MKQVMNYHKDNGLLNMIRRTDPMINIFREYNLEDHGVGSNDHFLSILF